VTVPAGGARDALAVRLREMAADLYHRRELLTAQEYGDLISAAARLDLDTLPARDGAAADAACCCATATRGRIPSAPPIARSGTCPP